MPKLSALGSGHDAEKVATQELEDTNLILFLILIPTITRPGGA